MTIKTKKVYVAWTNTDCTEGRGAQIPLCVCDLFSTAIRRGKGGSVQGTNCRVTEEVAYFIDGKWRYPGYAVPASPEDIREQARLDAAAAKEADRIAVIAKAIELGLTEEDAAKL